MSNAVVIGASGAIGRALCEQVVASGSYRTTFALARSEIIASAPVRAGRIDVVDERSIARAADNVAREGPVGLVIVATGILHGPGISPEKSLAALDPGVMGTVFAVNTIGPALVAKHFVPLLPRRGRSVFAALSARVGSIGDNRLGGWYAYRASKAALNQIIRTLAVETARTRPDALVVGLHPGTVASELSRPFRSADGRPAPFTAQESAMHLVQVLDRLSQSDSGHLLAWDGQQIPF
jgi:NAD(P)-dependent dehydrogenase (short-subunit alcohol dehydrogenase family)